MSSRSLNRVQLIGNLTRDVELRYTPSGTAVATIGLATNRSWTDGSGQKQEETEFHRLVAWSKLAELCSQLLFKGRKIYVEGRLQTRKWQGQDGNDRYTTEIVISDMIILDRRRREGSEEYRTSNNMASQDVIDEVSAVDVPADEVPAETVVEDKPETDKKEETKKEEEKSSEVSADDIPF